MEHLGNKLKKYHILILLLILFNVILFALALMIGKFPISFKTFFSLIFSNSNDFKMEKSIIIQLRLPRTIMALLIGAALSISGLVYQEIFQNKLVSPSLLGVSSGAGVGAAISIVLGLSLFLTSALAFIFAILTVLITLTIAKLFKNNSSTILLLSGIIIGGFMSASLSMVKFLADRDTTLAEITYWLMGSFSSAQMSNFRILAPIIIIGIMIIYITRWRINIVALGYEEAQTTGIDYILYRRCYILIVTLMTAISVSFAGTIGWVGLVIPHIVRNIVGRNTKNSVPVTILFGSAFMVLCDILSRTFTSSEIPISAVTGFLATPIFIWMLFIRKEDMEDA